tara:strand:- start:561 stop:1625 length:1065 start_codon:yes stop_codon:yes gene_type:complete
MSKENKQLVDDPELLQLMIDDTNNASSLFKPTNFWEYYNAKIISEIKEKGLKNFRRDRNSMFNKIGAVDFEPYSFFLDVKSSDIKQIFSQILLKFIMKLKRLKIPEDSNIDSFKRAEKYGKSKDAKSIYKLSASLTGNPENLFYVNKIPYTTLLLRYYVEYAYCCEFMDFNSITTMLDFGGGSGRQIEVLRKLHPNICFYFVEIPPQLYVAEQYLSALFPDSVVSYRETRKMNKLPEPEPGKIYILNTWQISKLNLEYDLFWNADSFHEIEPQIVLEYLKIINRQTKKFVFIHDVMKGDKIAKEEGGFGVLQKTTLNHFKKGLTDFSLKNISQAFQVPKLLLWTSYKYSFWNKK